MAVCVHEAGHAVAHLLYRIPMKHISVIPNTETTGHVLSVDKRRDERLNQDWNERRSRDYAERLIKCALAGGIAQKKYNPRTFRHFHSSLDWDNAISFATTNCGSLDEAIAWCNLLFIQAKQDLLLDRNWAAVMVLANTLKKEKQISSRRMRELFRKTTNLPSHSL